MTRIGRNAFGGKKWFVPEPIQSFDFSDHIQSLNHFDSIVDMDGRGITVYVHRYPGCKDIFHLPRMAIIVTKCPMCYSAPFSHLKR